MGRAQAALSFEYILGVLQTVSVVDVHAFHSRAMRNLQRGQTMGKVRLCKHKIILVTQHSRHFSLRSEMASETQYMHQFKSSAKNKGAQ